MAAPDKPKTEAPPGDPDDSHPLKRTIAISLASVVVLAGLLAVLQIDASVRESTTARETTRTAVRALRANVTESTILGLEDQLVGERDSVPFRRPFYEAAPNLTDAVGIPRDDAAIAARIEATDSALPVEDMAEALSRLRYETARTTLKQQALATTRITWNTRSTQYTTVIAVLSAALFLVGFGLIVEGRLRSYSYVLGLVIAVFVIGWAAWIYHLPIPSTPDAAIEAAARASALSDQQDYRGAVAEYDAAIAVDSDYAAAYRGRAIARLLAANPDYRTTRAITDPGGKAADEAVRDAERALDLQEGPDFLGVSFLALEALYRGEFQEAIDRADEAIGLNPDVPDVRFLKSAAEVALGDLDAAKASRDGAIDLLRGSNPTERTRLLASTYLSYLEWVEWKAPRYADDAQMLADELVETETAFTLGRDVSGSVPAGADVEVKDLRYADGKITGRLLWRGLPPNTALTVLGYERPIADGPWTQPTDLALFINASGDGERRISVAIDRTCRPTEVRADVYLDGASALSQTGPGVAATC